MKHAISFYIDDESEIIGLCGSVVVETDYDKAITCFNFNRDQLKTKNALYVGQNGQGMLINGVPDYHEDTDKKESKDLLKYMRECCCDNKEEG